MSKFAYGKSSRRRMLGVYSPLILTAERALSKSTWLDWGVGSYGGKRSVADQQALYKRGVTRADGIKYKSYHQTGLALDLVPWIDGKFTWENKQAFIEISKLMFESWVELKQEGKIPQDAHLHWGGFWGKNAVDKNNNQRQDPNELGWDAPHFEVRKYPQKINFQRIWDV